MGLKAYGKKAIQAFVDDGIEFDHETIKGKKYGRWDEVPLGRLSEKRPPNYDEHWSAHPVRVIFSYKTPIAWRFDGTAQDWTVPEIHYSVTTTHHQNVVRVAVDNKGFYSQK